MAEIKQDTTKSEDSENYSVGNSADPKNMQELTQYRNKEENTFTQMCGAIWGENKQLILSRRGSLSIVQTLLQNMQDKFQSMSDQIIGRIDDMGNKIDDLEKNIADLMTQAGVEGTEK